MFKVFLIVLIGIGLCFALYPFRKNWKGCLVMMPLFILGSLLGYLQWGSYYQLHQHELSQNSIAEVREMLQSPEGQDALIQKIKASLEKTPTDIKGWLLLGRLQVRFGHCKEAIDALASAYALRPKKDTDITMNYAETLFVCNNEEMNEDITRLVNQVIKKNPKHLGALAMLAKEAYNKKQDAIAIGYWKEMLSQLPNESEEAIQIRKAIDMTTSRKRGA
jgi:cytochrome c-type biogenesis protein CcmH